MIYRIKGYKYDRCELKDLSLGMLIDDWYGSGCSFFGFGGVCWWSGNCGCVFLVGVVG